MTEKGKITTAGVVALALIAVLLGVYTMKVAHSEYTTTTVTVSINTPQSAFTTIKNGTGYTAYAYYYSSNTVTTLLVDVMAFTISDGVITYTRVITSNGTVVTTSGTTVNTALIRITNINGTLTYASLSYYSAVPPVYTFTSRMSILNESEYLTLTSVAVITIDTNTQKR